MKKIFISFSAVLLLNACQKEVKSDTMLQEEFASKIQTQKAMITRPMQVDFYSNPDITVPPVQCIPQQFGNVFVGGGMFIHGNAAHVGLIDSENSWGRTQYCQFGPAPYQLTTRSMGQIAAANGDLLYFSSNELTSVIDGAFTGVVTITGGTGRFTDATGSVDIHGTVNFQSGIVSWTGIGTITY